MTGNENGSHVHTSGTLAVSGNAPLGSLYGPGTSGPITRVNYFGTDGRPAVGGAGVNIVSTSLTGNGQQYNSSGLTVQGSDFTFSGAANSAGLGTAHNTVQPTIIANFRIKL